MRKNRASRGGRARKAGMCTPQGYPTIPRGLFASPTKSGEGYFSSQRHFTHKRASISAFTLIELVMTILILSIMATILVPRVVTVTDADRFELTRSKMQAIRIAILGNSAVDFEDHPMRFGYVGDMGKLPDTLNDLVNAELPSWSFDSVAGFGSGWRGPYVTSKLSQSNPISKDGWGRDFLYAPAASPPLLKSFGADAVSGGTSFNTDLILEFPVFSHRANVRGIASDGATRLSNTTVEIRYPVNGTVNVFTTTTDAQGGYSFPNVPFGIRSLKVGAVPALGPRNLTVESPETTAPIQTTDYSGGLQAISVDGGSVATSGPGSSYVTFNLTSSYSTIRQLRAMSVLATKRAYLTRVTFHGTQIQVLPNLPRETYFDVATTLTLAANSSGNPVELRFAKNADGTGNINMGSEGFQLVMEWMALGERDSIAFDTP